MNLEMNDCSTLFDPIKEGEAFLNVQREDAPLF